MWGSRKIRGTFLGVERIRTVTFLGSVFGVPLLWETIMFFIGATCLHEFGEHFSPSLLGDVDVCGLLGLAHLWLTFPVVVTIPIKSVCARYMGSYYIFPPPPIPVPAPTPSLFY